MNTIMNNTNWIYTTLNILLKQYPNAVLDEYVITKERSIEFKIIGHKIEIIGKGYLKYRSPIVDIMKEDIAIEEFSVKIDSRSNW